MIERPDPAQSVVRLAVVFEGGLALVAALLAWLTGIPLLDQIDWTPAGLAWGLVAAVPLIAALLLVTRYPLGPIAELQDLMRRTILPLFRACTLADLLVISLLAGFGEELLFRGLAQRGIEQLSGSAWIGVLVASALFALAHAVSRTYALLAGLISLYFGWLLVAGDNLLVPIVAHAAYDFVALIYLLRDDADAQEGANAEEGIGG